MMGSWITFSLVISISRLIVASRNYDLEPGFDPPFDNENNNTTTVDLLRAARFEKTRSSISKLVSMPRERNVRVLNAYTQHSIMAQSLTQEIYGIVDLPEADTKETFQEIYDEYVESYFSLNVDPKLVVDSKIIVTDVLVPSIGNRYLRQEGRNLDILQDSDRKYEGSSVIITFDQQLSYYFPEDGGILAIETLATLPFITESGRNEFNLKLKDSGDSILQDVVGVSGVHLPPQSSIPKPINSPTQRPPEPVSEPQPSVSAPINSPPKDPPTKSPTPFPSKRPTPSPIQTRSPLSPPSKSPVPPPSNPPTLAPTARPTSISTKSNTTPTEKNVDSGGINGLIILGSLMTVLFIVFTINMKYCMGEYVD